MILDTMLHIRGNLKDMPPLKDGQIGVVEDRKTLIFGTVDGNVVMPSAQDFQTFKDDIINNIIGDTNNLTTINKIIVNAINELNAKGGVGGSGGGTVNYTTWSYTATADNTSTFDIVNNGIYDPIKDTIQMFKDGILLEPTKNYTLSGLTVTLTDWVLNTNDSIYMLIYKVSQMTGEELVDGTVTKAKLETSVQNTLTNADKIGDLTTLKTTDKTSIVNAINENTSQLAEKSNSNTINAKIIDIRKQYKSQMTIFTLPNDFAYVPITIFGDSYGNYSTNFDVSVFKNTGGKTIYMSLIGSDSNDGSTEALSVSTLSKAYALANNGDTIIIDDGIYPYSSSFMSIHIEKNLNIIAKNIGKVIFKCGDNYSYNLYGTNTYGQNTYHTTAQYVRKVIYMMQDKDIDSTVELSQVNDLTTCQSTKMSWCLVNNTDFYVNVGQNKVVSNDNLILILSYGTPMIDVRSTTQNVLTYIEGINFIGADGDMISIIGQGSYMSSYLYAKNCKFKHGGIWTTNSLFRGAGVSVVNGGGYLQNCESAYNIDDGIAITDNQGYRGILIEVNCISHDNGHGASFENVNGSTSHNGAMVIRLNGVYYDNYGGNVADVQTNTVSYNFNCIAFDSLFKSSTTDTDLYETDFVAQQSGAIVNCYGCKAFGSKYSGYAVSGGTININNCNFESIGGSGTVILNN